MHFYQDFLPRNSCLFLAALMAKTKKKKKKKKKVFAKNLGLCVATMMAKTNFRPFYVPENGKPFQEKINRAKRPSGPHKIASWAKCGPWATGWAALMSG